MGYFLPRNLQKETNLAIIPAKRTSNNEKSV